MNASTSHAVVIGGSIAGLLAAHVLAQHFGRITLLDRDRLPREPEPRKGVPQGRHCHVMLMRGQRLIEGMLPGFESELVAQGAAQIDWLDHVAFHWHGQWAPRFPSRMQGHCASRDLIEFTLRRRLAELTNVEILEGRDASGLVVYGREVRGVRIRGADAADGGVLEADLVVDASGRHSRTPQWLNALGYPAVTESVVDPKVGYASQVFEPPPGTNVDWKIMVVREDFPGTRAAGIYPMERGRWLLTLLGYGAECPPTDDAGFREFLKRLPSNAVDEALCGARAVSSIAGFRGTTNQWRHYEHLRRAPERLVVIGDANCSFNPAYAQGMTVAALSADLLHANLARERRRGWGFKGFGPKFHRQLARINAAAWMMATSEDFRYETTVGGSPSVAVRWMHRYLDRVLVQSLYDQHLRTSFVEVMHMLRSPAALFRPSVVWRLLSSQARASS